MDELLSEILPEHIQKLSDLGKTINNSRLKQKVILLLLKDMTGLNLAHIETVLNALPLLESKYLKPLSKKE